MEKVKSFLKKSGTLVEEYKFDKFFKVNDIDKIINLIHKLNIKITGGRLSNSLEQPEHLFRSFDSLEALSAFSKDDYCIDDFGVHCVYNEISFDLTFDFDSETVITFSEGNIDLIFLLVELENLTKLCD